MAAERVIVIGGGHNGLVAAAYLAKAGKDVTLLERSEPSAASCGTARSRPGSRRRGSRTRWGVSGDR